MQFMVAIAKGDSVVISMTVFDAFSNAIESGWKIAPMAYSTITGNIVDFSQASDIDVIIDEGSSSDANQSPNYAVINSDTLIYTKPAQMPTLDSSELVSDYTIIDTNSGKYYEITDAGIGKNQENGVIEHVEMKIRQVGVTDGS